MQKFSGFPSAEHIPATFTLLWFDGVLELAGGLRLLFGPHPAANSGDTAIL